MLNQYWTSSEQCWEPSITCPQYLLAMNSKKGMTRATLLNFSKFKSFVGYKFYNKLKTKYKPKIHMQAHQYKPEIFKIKNGQILSLLFVKENLKKHYRKCIVGNTFLKVCFKTEKEEKRYYIGKTNIQHTVSQDPLCLTGCYCLTKSNSVHHKPPDIQISNSQNVY